jgi:hypothetical protein
MHLIFWGVKADGVEEGGTEFLTANTAGRLNAESFHSPSLRSELSFAR